MRFVWAVAAFFLAAVLIGAGIAQRTVFVGPETEQTAITTPEDLPYTLIDGEVLNRLPGAQTLTARSDGTIFAAYGRTADMKAWLADTSYNGVEMDAGEVTAEVVEPAPVEVTSEPAAPSEDEAATEPAPRSPIGSDLWLDEYQQDDELIQPLQLPDEMSLLLATDGVEPAPSDVTITWPLSNATPWAGPLIAAGGAFLALGVFLYILAIRHVRRSRGPRRKGPPPLEATQPISVSAADERGVISAGTPARALGRRRRSVAIIPVVAVSALLVSGCSPESWPQLSASPTPSATPTVIPDAQQAPAVTEAQAERILVRVSESVAAADEAKDPALAAERLDGPVLAERATNYTLRNAIADRAAPSPIPAAPLKIVLPQAFDGWPRTFMSVVEDDTDATVPPTIMMLTQQDAWSEYKVSYLGNMEASVVLPDLAPAWLGATQVQPNSSFLTMAPDQVAAAYADILNNGESSEYYDAFESDGDQFRLNVAANRVERTAAFNETASTTATTGNLAFAASAGSFDPTALATLESGAILAVSVSETDTVTPTTADAVIKFENNQTVRALTGVEESATGVTTTFSDQLFFYVPAQGSGEKIQLLGYGSNLLEAKVIS